MRAVLVLLLVAILAVGNCDRQPSLHPACSILATFFEGVAVHVKDDGAYCIGIL